MSEALELEQKIKQTLQFIEGNAVLEAKREITQSGRHRVGEFLIQPRVK
jgi:hypothetical protein